MVLFVDVASIFPPIRASNSHRIHYPNRKRNTPAVDVFRLDTLRDTKTAFYPLRGTTMGVLPGVVHQAVFKTRLFEKLSTLLFIVDIYR